MKDLIIVAALLAFAAYVGGCANSERHLYKAVKYCQSGPCS